MHFTERTPRLLLKILGEEEAPAVLEFYQKNREHLRPFEPQGPDVFYTLPYQQKLLAYEFQEMMKGTTLRYFLYLSTEPSRIIGSVNLTDIVHGSFCKASLGYKLDADMVGYGYASEAVIHLLELARTSLRLHRIEARVVPDNEPSIALLNRLHFQYEGVEFQGARISGAWRDLLRYSIILNPPVSS